MFRLYFGLLLTAWIVAAHATEAESAGILLSKSDQSIIRFVGSSADYLSPYRLADSSTASNRTAAVATRDVALGGSGFGSTSERSAISKPEKETATNASWGSNYGGNRILSLARHKRVEFMADRFKVTLRQDSALIETGNLKVALRSGSTSMLWSKAL